VRLFKAPHLVGCRSDQTYPALHSQLRSRGPLRCTTTRPSGPLKTHRQRGVSSVSGILDVLECRVFMIDIETCRRCGGKLRVMASIEEPAVIERILDHLGRMSEPLDRARAPRAPPQSIVYNRRFAEMQIIGVYAADPERWVRFPSASAKPLVTRAS
jgi:hypothetical protein